MSTMSDTLLHAFTIYDRALAELDSAVREPHDSPWHAVHMQAFGSLQDEAISLAQGVGCTDLEFVQLHAEYRS